MTEQESQLYVWGPQDAPSSPAGTVIPRTVTLGPGQSSRDRVDPEKLKQSFQAIADTMKSMCQSVQNLADGYSIDTITLRFGVEAEGGFSFVAKAGVQADIEIIIKRDSP